MIASTTLAVLVVVGVEAAAVGELDRLVGQRREQLGERELGLGARCRRRSAGCRRRAPRSRARATCRNGIASSRSKRRPVGGHARPRAVRRAAARPRCAAPPTRVTVAGVAQPDRRPGLVPCIASRAAGHRAGVHASRTLPTGRVGATARLARRVARTPERRVDALGAQLQRIRSATRHVAIARLGRSSRSRDRSGGDGDHPLGGAGEHDVEGGAAGGRLGLDLLRARRRRCRRTPGPWCRGR